MKKAILAFFVVLVLLIAALAITLKVRYGGGKHYPDISTDPLLGSMNLETVFSFDEPLGNLAVSGNSRLFFTVHPESRPEKNKVMEVVDGKAYPYPDQAFQQSHFNTVLGMFIDEYDRLWTIDHGNHGFQDVRLLAFDLNTDQIVHDYVFPPEIAEKGSFFNDLQVSSEGVVYIADVSFFGKNPAIIVYDIETGESRRLLEGHESITPQDWIIRNPLKEMVFFGGLVALKPGIDGIVLDTKGEYIYYGAMTHDGLFKISTKALNDLDLLPEQLAREVVKVGQKPLSDGLSIDTLDNIYITDVEHGGVAKMSPEGNIVTLIKDNDKVRWADGFSYGGDGLLYFTDSAIPDQMLRSKSHMKSKAPYFIYRFNTGVGGIAGR